MKSLSPEDKQVGRALLLHVSAEHGDAAAEAQQGLLPEGHMAYWRR